MAQSSPTASAIPGLESPLGVISPTNQTGLIAIITSVALTFVLVSFSIRIYVRRSNGPWRGDDNVLTAASILSCIQSALVFFEVGKGLGKDTELINDHELEHMQKAYFANNIIYIILLLLSKCSVGFLYRRLTPARGHKIAVWSILGLLAVWTGLSIMLITIKCPWDKGCTDMFARWQAIGAIDIFSDVALFLMSIYLVKDLQIPWKPKAIVVMAFSSRLFVIPACALRLHYLNPDTLSSDRTLAGTLAVCCTQLQLGYGIMSATIPCLKPFVAVYEQGNPNHESSNYGQLSGSTYNLASVNSTAGNKLDLPKSPLFLEMEDDDVPSTPQQQKKRSSQQSITPDKPPGTRGSTTLSTPVPGTKADKSSIHSRDSQKMIIERTTSWSVRYENENEK